MTTLANNPEQAGDLNLIEVLRYLSALPMSSHTVDSLEGLLQLTRVPGIEAATMLQAASLASQIAVNISDRPRLSRARFKQGLALTRLGKFAEATAAQAEAWSVARELNDKNLELNAIWGFSTISVAMAQWTVAIGYCERMRALAESLGLVREEFIARNNIADCALQLGDAELAMGMLSKLAEQEPYADLDSSSHMHLHNNLARAYLLVGDVFSAHAHVEQAAHLAAAWRESRLVHCVQAIRGLIDVRMGMVETGIAAIQTSLEFSKRDNQTEVPDTLGICIDACEAAGRFDEALLYLEELVEWKKRSVDADIARHFQGLQAAVDLQEGPSVIERGLLAKGHTLRVEVRNQIDRLLEIAVNAEVASGYDLYRPFRLANLARHLAALLNWDQHRIELLVLGAQLCNIGMIAIPARISFKPGPLSEGESKVLHSHTTYGAELLRRSKLQIVETAAIVAEQHHERYDGGGYPAGLAGEAIADEARLIALCDAFDAITHARPFRGPSLQPQAALSEIIRAAGSQFDQRYVCAFSELVKNKLSRYQDLDAFLAEGADEHQYVRVRARMDAAIAGDR